MLYRLIVLSGPLTGQRITVDKEPMTLGRDADAAVVLPDEEIAMHHAELAHSDHGLVIRDLGSMNRILVNKREVREARLKHGDIFEIGRTRFLVQACVQAEVDGRVRCSKARRPRAMAAAALLFVASFAAWLKIRPDEVRAPVAPANATPPAAEHVTAPAINEPAASSEFRQMRDQLEDIRSTVQNLVDKERAPAASSMSYPMLDPIRQKTQKMLEDAKRAAENGHVADADQILSNIQLIDPELLEAYLQRASLFEKRGMLKKAVDQWGEIARRSSGTPLYERAIAERHRVMRLDDANAAAAGQRLSIASVEPQRFPGSDEFDELRTLKISLRPESSGQTLDTDAVRVEVSFYDENTISGTVAPSRFSTSGAGLRIEGAWGPDEVKTVAATYAVPRGFREGRPEHFYGYSVSVFYHDILQDSDARPRSLQPDDKSGSAPTNYLPSAGARTTS